jgi:hypothetical protein
LVQLEYQLKTYEKLNKDLTDESGILKTANTQLKSHISNLDNTI